MKGDPAVIKNLQDSLPMEAQLNLQYRKDWRNLKFRGLRKLAKKVHGLGTDAHEWMKAVNDRILFLGGDDSYSIAPITESTSVTALLQNELALEMAVIAPYEQNVQTAMKALDDTSRNLFEHLLKWHEKHVAWLEQQIMLITALGEEIYLSEKI